MKWLCLLLIFFATQVQGQETTFNRPVVFPPTEGTYVVGDWKYVYSISNPKTKSQGAWGRLYYQGKELTASKNVAVNTPVGEFIFLGGLDVNGWGEHGWFNTCAVKDNGLLIKGDDSMKLIEGQSITHIYVFELLEWNKGSAYHLKESPDWRTAKIGSYVELPERDNGILKYRAQINGCDVIALSRDIGSGIYVEDLRIYIQKATEMRKVLSLPLTSRQFLLKEEEGKLQVFIASKAGTSASTIGTPAISVDLAQLVQAYGDAVPSSKKD